MRLGLALVTAAVAVLGTAPSPAGGAEAAVSVAITAPAPSALVSRNVPVEATTTGPAVSVTFAWSADGGASWQPIETDVSGGPTWSAVWSSTPHDGPARLRATATDGAEEATDQIGVIVDNTAPDVSVNVVPTPFSPNGDGRRDRTTIRVSVSEAASIRVRVRGSGGTIRREWSRSRGGPGVVRIEWNGRAGGSTLPDGAYRVEARATDAVGLSGEGGHGVVLDTRAPATRWRGISPDPLVRQRRLVFSFRARDRAPQLRVDLRVFDAAGRRMARIRRTVDPGIRRVAWRPRAPTGGRLYPGGHRAVLRVTDDAGNRTPPRERHFRVHRSAPPQIFRRLSGTGRRVALTFDDCHVRSAWSRILDVLRRKGVEATFFCPGQLVRWNPDLARRTVREGHTPASHAWDHANLAGRGVEATAWRLRADAAAWWDVTGRTSAPYFRPPYGSYDRAVLTGAGQAFHPRVMLWDVDTNDWRRPGASVIASRVIGGSRPGSVVLMHTLDQTASALPSIIDGLRRRGVEPVSLPRLFRAAGLP